MTFEIKGLEKVTKDLAKLSTQIDYAAMLTLNDLAFDTKRALDGELRGGLNVRLNTSKAFAVDKAKKSDLTATVRMKRDWHYLSLQHHYQKKEAFQIGFEREMISRGYMTGSNSAVPIKKMGKAKYKSLLNSTRRGVRSKYFVVSTSSKNKRTAHLHPGIYQRMKRKPKPVMLFTAEAQYRKRFDMFTTSKKVVERRAKEYFFKNIERALRTAK